MDTQYTFKVYNLCLVEKYIFIDFAEPILIIIWIFMTEIINSNF